jgi:hypothetical protein
LTGQKFGRITVLKRAENNKYGYKMWLCQCECKEKNIKIILENSLKRGLTRSCGCLNKERLVKYNKENKNKKYNIYNLTGEYGIGYTSKGEEFYFDLEDHDLIKNYYWSVNTYGYIITNLYEEKTILFMHRLVMNCPDDMEIDHKFHKKHDNRKSELRIVTRSQNQMNVDLKSHNTSGVKGVSWHKYHEKWRVFISVNKKQIHLGYFNNFEEAIKVRKAAEEKYYREYGFKEN